MRSSPLLLATSQLLATALSSAISSRTSAMTVGSAPNVSATTAAIGAMNSFYDWNTGLWDMNGASGSQWWHSAIALQDLIDFMIKTGQRDYLSQAENTIQNQLADHHQLLSDSTDDTAWWALALTSMYQLTGQADYLIIAESDADYIGRYGASNKCGGGIIWQLNQVSPYQNAICNELYIELTATLYNLTQNQAYLTAALDTWNWFNASGLINGDWLINDGLTESCENNGVVTWTYNQGVILGGLVELYKATWDLNYLTTAQNIADAVLASPQLVTYSGSVRVLTEPCSLGQPENCEDDGWAFKGIFIRYLSKLDIILPDRPYAQFIADNANTAFQKDRRSPEGSSDFYGGLWQGPMDTISLHRQASAVALLISAVAVP